MSKRKLFREQDELEEQEILAAQDPKSPTSIASEPRSPALNRAANMTCKARLE